MPAKLSRVGVCFLTLWFGFGVDQGQGASSPQPSPPGEERGTKVLEWFGGSPTQRRALSVSPARVVTSLYGTSYQANVSASGQNIVGDAANEPSLCVDPNNPQRIAIGWRQFDTITNSFREAGWAYSTNGGVNWTFGGVLETNAFRSDPVLASDANGNFYYMSLQPTPYFNSDVWKSTNGGLAWQRVGPALGGDKEWMVIDRTSGSGRGNIYECWSTAGNHYATNIFSRSTDAGQTWVGPVGVPELPYWATMDIGPQGELYHFGWNGAGFWLNRSTNAAEGGAITFDLTAPVDLGGGLLFLGSINPEGLVGQPYVAVDRSGGATRGNVYALCTVSRKDSVAAADVMFARSSDGGATWSAPVLINTDSPTPGAWHWFGTMSVAPGGRIDVCWLDTRSDPTNSLISELYYSYSLDGGVSWAANRAISPPFDPTLGYPSQLKMGDYIGMVSLDDAACVAYTATFNGEEDVYFIRADQAPVIRIVRAGEGVQLTWDTVPGRSYCLQAVTDLGTPWNEAAILGCFVATNLTAAFQDAFTNAPTQRFYRVVSGGAR